MSRAGYALTAGVLLAEVKVWDIVAELVSICCSPPPANPFSVDHAFFERMEPFEAMLATSATVNLLNRILDSGMHDYDDKIAEDIHKLMLLHFQVGQEVTGGDRCFARLLV